MTYGWPCCVSIPVVHLLYDFVLQCDSGECAPANAYTFHEIHWLLCLHIFQVPFLHGSYPIVPVRLGSDLQIPFPRFPSTRFNFCVMPPSFPVSVRPMYSLSRVWTYVVPASRLLSLVAHCPHLNLPYRPLPHLSVSFF
jgi:hypothetical protein